MELIWKTSAVTVSFSLEDGPVRLLSISPGPAGENSGQPLVEISALGHGRSPATLRHVGTHLGRQLRYHSHDSDADQLRIVQVEPSTGLQVTSVFKASEGVAGFQTWTEATLTGPGELELDFLSTAVLRTGAPDQLELVAGVNDWMAENRWTRRPLRELLPDIQRDPHHPESRGRHAVTASNSWSTGEVLPTGVLVSPDAALGWQIEHNGPWHYELGDTRYGGYLLLSGPTDQEHQWTVTVSADKPFRTVPASIVTATGHDQAFAALTRQRRAIRPADDRRPVIFNDYMNTLMGDPTTEKLLPLIDAAASVGADGFCIDAGWYAEGDWWNTVGEWKPSTTRFPNGLGEVIDRIRAHGMIPGLWLEPEVIGIDSPLARQLPDSAFISRRGVRVSEGGRHLLDLRSPAARRHLDETVDVLVSEYGIGFFKLDYNTMTGPGTDSDGQSLGQGLLEHNRAHLDWLDGIQARHPELLLENCASGAMRMDYALLSRLHLQSTSDQQDPVLYAPIAAAAPASVVPEQAGNWAYPQTGTSPERFTFCLVNGILGRMYLSGYLDKMTSAELDLVRTAISRHRLVLGEPLTPFWPLGLPGWTDEWVVLGLAGKSRSYLTIWHREAGPAEVELPLPPGRIADFFPLAADGWSYLWQAGGLKVSTDVAEPSARVITLFADD
ncbi:glycoside hydrolase family 36 protein [Kribbella sp. NPDC051620]|uniref:glycoside hydrolase family 36 protein n=1 Tax=Kribbella sp. NPDC051620 TaxID=3364120 RepID=UPI0037BC14FB